MWKIGFSCFGAALVATFSVQAVGVVTAQATQIEFPLVVEALGTAQANESIDVRPSISETIVSIEFEEGQTVAAGDVLIRLDNSELKAQVAETQADLSDSDNQYRRAEGLFKTRAVSESEMETLTAQRQSDRAILQAAESRLEDAIVRAPFAGKVGLRRVSPGSYVTPQTIITTLDDTSFIKLDFDIPEVFLSHLRPGQTISATSVAWSDTTFKGEVRSVNTRIDPVTRTVTVRAIVDNADEKLLPGMFLTVRLEKGGGEALVIPEQAIVPEQSDQFVFTVSDQGVIAKKKIITGRRKPGLIEVIEGLQSGEIVVAEGTQRIRPGDIVEVVREISIEEQAQ